MIPTKVHKKSTHKLKIMKRIALHIILVFLAFEVHADSPLTFTNFGKSYKDLKIMEEVSKANGRLNIPLMDYLFDSLNPVDCKLALINQLGWSIDGKQNTGIYLKYIATKKPGFKPSKASGEVLICIAYLKALDNYFDVKDALLFAKYAKLKNPTSLSISIIHALIEAQTKGFSHWCEIYECVNLVRLNKKLNNDMRKTAVAIIYEYIEDYKKYCKP